MLPKGFHFSLYFGSNELVDVDFFLFVLANLYLFFPFFFYVVTVVRVYQIRFKQRWKINSEVWSHSKGGSVTAITFAENDVTLWFWWLFHTQNAITHKKNAKYEQSLYSWSHTEVGWKKSGSHDGYDWNGSAIEFFFLSIDYDWIKENFVSLPTGIILSFKNYFFSFVFCLFFHRYPTLIEEDGFVYFFSPNQIINWDDAHGY